MPKSTPKNTHQSSSIILIQDVRINSECIVIFQLWQTCDMHNMAEIEKEAVGFPIEWQHLIFHLFTLFSCIEKIVNGIKVDMKSITW